MLLLTIVALAGWSGQFTGTVSEAYTYAILVELVTETVAMWTLIVLDILQIGRGHRIIKRQRQLVILRFQTSTGPTTITVDDQDVHTICLRADRLAWRLIGATRA